MLGRNETEGKGWRDLPILAIFPLGLIPPKHDEVEVEEVEIRAGDNPLALFSVVSANIPRFGERRTLLFVSHNILNGSLFGTLEQLRRRERLGMQANLSTQEVDSFLLPGGLQMRFTHPNFAVETLLVSVPR